MSQPPPAPAQPKSAAEIEREQEAKLKAKYGGLQPKRKLMPKEHKFFDSADWALSKQGVKPEQPAPLGPSNLEPKLGPSHHLAPRRTSHLGDE